MFRKRITRRNASQITADFEQVRAKLTEKIFSTQGEVRRIYPSGRNFLTRSIEAVNLSDGVAMLASYVRVGNNDWRLLWKDYVGSEDDPLTVAVIEGEEQGDPGRWLIVSRLGVQLVSMENEKQWLLKRPFDFEDVLRKAVRPSRGYVPIVDEPHIVEAFDAYQMGKADIALLVHSRLIECRYQAVASETLLSEELTV